VIFPLRAAARLAFPVAPLLKISSALKNSYFSRWGFSAEKIFVVGILFARESGRLV
jgi:hypothetical protein